MARSGYPIAFPMDSSRKEDSNVNCFWNARVRKPTTIVVQDFKSAGARSALDFHLDVFGGCFGFLGAG
jgi:hypothetical protein